MVGATTRLRELVELGADINREGDGNPLAIAYRERRPEVVATLLDLGADPDPSGVSPSPLVECLTGAARDLPATLAIARMLLDAGVPVTREARAVAWALVERPEGVERLVSLTLEWVLGNPVTVCR